jgi:Mrp family chromosome partitioning ATPase
VILDSPPVMAVSDARIISQLADYTIFVVHWAKTPRDVVKSAVAALLGVTDRVGIVINKVNLAKHALYEYGDYGDYYSRYNSYYGANPNQRGAAGEGNRSRGGAREQSPAEPSRTRRTTAEDESGIAKLKRIVPRVK